MAVDPPSKAYQTLQVCLVRFVQTPSSLVIRTHAAILTAKTAAARLWCGNGGATKRTVWIQIEPSTAGLL